MNKKTKLKINKIRKEIKSFWLLSSLAGILLLGAAVFQLNCHIHETSLLTDLEERSADILTENDSLEARLSQSNSLEQFNQYQVAQLQNYEKVDVAGVYYVRAAGGEFARK